MAVDETHLVGEMRVWHIPQIPGNPFLVPVSSTNEAIELMDILADYDLFQFENNIKPDYSNAQGLSIWDGEDWFDVDVTLEDELKYAKELAGE